MLCEKETAVVNDAYFTREGPGCFRPTDLVGGGWDPNEQHIAPVIGLIAHTIEVDRDSRGRNELQLTRLSCDILGTLPLEAVDVEITVLRPGRTIELVEARVSHAGRDAVIARAWLSHTYDTSTIAGTTLTSIVPPDEVSEWDFGSAWPGGFVSSLEVRRTSATPGRATAWMRTDVPLIAGEQVSATAAALALVDAANGIAARVSSEEVLFPNLDLTAHLVRAPEGEWTGVDTTVTFGPEGAGLTQSILHDVSGPIGAVAQTLTVRPR